MNKRGVVLSGLIYTLLVFFLLLLSSIIILLWNRQNAINYIKDEAHSIFAPYLATVIRPYLVNKNGSNYYVSEDPNNWVMVGVGQDASTPTIGLLWRIISSDNEGIKIILDKGYHINDDDIVLTDVIDWTMFRLFGSAPPPIASKQWDEFNSNKWHESSIKEELDGLYSSLLDDPDLSLHLYLSSIDYINWCTGAVYKDSGNFDFTVEDVLTSECQSRSLPGGYFPGRDLEPRMFGMINVSDFISTSAAPGCTDPLQLACSEDNFLFLPGRSYWTMNASGYDEQSVVVVNGDGHLDFASADSGGISGRLVVMLKPSVLYRGGTGTLEDPYMLESVSWGLGDFNIIYNTN